MQAGGFYMWRYATHESPQGSVSSEVNSLSEAVISTFRTLPSPVTAHELVQGLLNRVPVKRSGRPEDIAEAVLFLASAASAYVVGVEMNVDGGMSQL